MAIVSFAVLTLVVDERRTRDFARGASTAQRDGGTGRGPYVARSLVERQGGRLRVEDPEDGSWTP